MRQHQSDLEIIIAVRQREAQASAARHRLAQQIKEDRLRWPTSFMVRMLVFLRTFWR